MREVLIIKFITDMGIISKSVIKSILMQVERYTIVIVAFVVKLSRNITVRACL